MGAQASVVIASVDGDASGGSLLPLTAPGRLQLHQRVEQAIAAVSVRCPISFRRPPNPRTYKHIIPREKGRGRWERGSSVNTWQASQQLAERAAC